jgi:hypothetical protein
MLLHHAYFFIICLRKEPNFNYLYTFVLEIESCFEPNWLKILSYIKLNYFFTIYYLLGLFYAYGYAFFENLFLIRKQEINIISSIK